MPILMAKKQPLLERTKAIALSLPSPTTHKDQPKQRPAPGDGTGVPLVFGASRRPRSLKSHPHPPIANVGDSLAARSSPVLAFVRVGRRAVAREVGNENIFC